MRIEKPTLVVDSARVERNIQRMADKAVKSGVVFRPHFKTHQSPVIGEFFRKKGVNKITVSSVDMAFFFAEEGWDDITIAFPVNILQIDRINQLAGMIKLHLLVESTETIRFLADHITDHVSVWIEVDTGQKRSGIDAEDKDSILNCASAIEALKNLSFGGLLTHAGHTYRASSTEEIKRIYADSIKKLNSLRDKLLRKGIKEVELSVGDTPSCSIVEDLSEADEIRPGNFVYYDLKQLELGSCKEEDIAVAVGCPVVAKCPRRNEVIVYGGAVHLSKEHLVDSRNCKIFGRIAMESGEKWGTVLDDSYVSSLSQEHGVIKTTPEILNQVNRGDILYIIPVHSCLAANLLRDPLILP